MSRYGRLRAGTTRAAALTMATALAVTLAPSTAISASQHTGSAAATLPALGFDAAPDPTAPAAPDPADPVAPDLAAPVAPEITDVTADAPTAAEAADLGPDDDGNPVTPQDDVVTAASDVSGFATVGVVWDGSATPDGVDIEVRTAGADGVWGAWEHLHVEPGAEESTSGGTAPMVVGNVARVEMKTQGALAAGLSNVRLAVIDPGTGLVDAAAALPGTSPAGASAAAAFGPVAAVAPSTTGGPAILSRADWGADESMATWSPARGDYKGAVIHHTAGTNNYSAADVPSILRGIYAYHAITRNWGDIGYNFLVDKFGRIWEGRKGGIESETIGGHAVGWNAGTVGVSLMGNYDTAAVPAAAVDAIVRLLGWKLSLHGVRANTNATINGRVVNTIQGHRDVAQTACPGVNLYSRLGEIRTRTAAEQGKYGSIFGLDGPAKITVTGQILKTWNAQGGASGFFRKPTSPVRCRADGWCAQEFERGTIVSRPGSTAQLWVIGAVRDHWLREGGMNGFFRAPLGTEQCRADKVCTQRFERGTLAYRPGTAVMQIIGAVHQYWLENGGLNGYFNAPRGNEICRSDKVCTQRFDRGTIAFRPGYGILQIIGAVHDRWLAEGGLNGYFNAPVTNEACRMSDKVCSQRFDRGTIVWRPGYGIIYVLNGINQTWLSTGGQAGRFGYPLQWEVASPGRASQRFEGGTITWP